MQGQIADLKDKLALAKQKDSTIEDLKEELALAKQKDSTIESILKRLDVGNIISALHRNLVFVLLLQLLFLITFFSMFLRFSVRKAC